MAKRVILENKDPLFSAANTPESREETSDAIKAIDYVTNTKKKGVNIVGSNNSWGSGGQYNMALFAAISRANSADILFVAAAGNENKNIDEATTPSYPSCFSLPNIISVAALNADGTMRGYWNGISYIPFSNYGVNNVDIAAPGVDIFSTLPNNNYGYMTGTSQAAPQVTGAIALLKSYAPGYGPDHLMTDPNLKSILLDTSRHVNGISAKTTYDSMPSVLEMLKEADRRGFFPAPAPTSTSSQGLVEFSVLYGSN